MKLVCLILSAGFILSALVSVTDFTVLSPYQPRSNSYKGQLHSHTTNSDGKQAPAELALAYKKAGYSFIAITDHNYRGKYRSNITILPQTIPGFIALPAMEISSDGGGSNFLFHHMLAIGLTNPREILTPQGNIDYCKEQGAFVVLCHPNWKGDHYTLSELWGLSNYNAIENAQAKWDYQLSRGKRFNMICSDDQHDVRNTNGFNKGFVVAFADTLSDKAILDSLKSGNYYSSTGALITGITVSNGAVWVKTPEISTIEFVIFSSYVAMKATNTNRAGYTIDGTESYIRVRVTRQSDKKMAYSNPIYINKK